VRSKLGPRCTFSRVLVFRALHRFEFCVGLLPKVSTIDAALMSASSDSSSGTDFELGLVGLRNRRETKGI